MSKNVKLALKTGSQQGLEEFDEHDRKSPELLKQAFSSNMDANKYVRKGYKGIEQQNRKPKLTQGIPKLPQGIPKSSCIYYQQKYGH